MKHGDIEGQGTLEYDGSDTNPTNLLSNGDFESWSAGTAVAPDGWTFGGASASVARESSTIKLGTYSVAITRSGADAYLYQTMHAEKGIAYWQGRTVTVGMWVWASVADRARILVGSNISAVTSSYHTGNSTWQWLTATKTVEGAATSLQVNCSLNDGDTTAYFDGAMLVEGSTPFAFSPKPAEEGVWTDYFASSNINGFTTPAGVIFTKKVGKMVFVNYVISGTSNAVNITFSLPYNASNDAGNIFTSTWGYGKDNGTVLTTVGRTTLSANGAVVTIMKDMASGAWTASGTKEVRGQFFYEAT